MPLTVNRTTIHRLRMPSLGSLPPACSCHLPPTVCVPLTYTKWRGDEKISEVSLSQDLAVPPPPNLGQRQPVQPFGSGSPTCTPRLGGRDRRRRCRRRRGTGSRRPAWDLPVGWVGAAAEPDV
eukprot:scaffold2274_cov82-Isochrysis_galbana.AAC.3